MNVIWKETKDSDNRRSADIEVVFKPKDVIDSLDQSIVIGISVKKAQ
jgi:hypothetical protein